MDRKTVGGFIGFAGGQVTALALFALLGKPCECTARLVCTDERCLWGQTFFEYWSRYGLGWSVLCLVLGAIIAEA